MTVSHIWTIPTHPFVCSRYVRAQHAGQYVTGIAKDFPEPTHTGNTILPSVVVCCVRYQTLSRVSVKRVWSRPSARSTLSALLKATYNKPPCPGNTRFFYPPFMEQKTSPFFFTPQFVRFRQHRTLQPIDLQNVYFSLGGPQSGVRCDFFLTINNDAINLRHFLHKQKKAECVSSSAGRLAMPSWHCWMTRCRVLRPASSSDVESDSVRVA